MILDELFTEDMDRRSFLKGMGAAAAAGATGMAQAHVPTQPAKKPEPTLQKLSPGAALSKLAKHAIRSGINHPIELSQFLAQCAAETGNFKDFVEQGNVHKLAKTYHRAGMGSKNPHEAAKFIGRGFIQLTGKNNYMDAGDDLHDDPSYYIKHPERISSSVDESARIAVWYWNKYVKPRVRDFRDTATVTRAINGQHAHPETIAKRHEYFKAYYNFVQENYAQALGGTTVASR